MPEKLALGADQFQAANAPSHILLTILLNHYFTIFINSLVMPMVVPSALDNASKILAAGRKIQSGHIRTLTENIANANSAAKTPGGDPYSRKTAVFSPIIADSGEDPVGQITRTTDNYRTKYDPADVAADIRGYVKLSNINVSEEGVKLQAVIRAYELNLSASASIDAAAKATLDLLK